MKIERLKLPFKPYQITIETQKEHDFLLGLFDATGGVQKKECENYSLNIDNEFHELLTEKP